MARISMTFGPNRLRGRHLDFETLSNKRTNEINKHFSKTFSIFWKSRNSIDVRNIFYAFGTELCRKQLVATCLFFVFFEKCKFAHHPKSANFFFFRNPVLYSVLPVSCPCLARVIPMSCPCHPKAKEEEQTKKSAYFLSTTILLFLVVIFEIFQHKPYFRTAFDISIETRPRYAP